MSKRSRSEAGSGREEEEISKEEISKELLDLLKTRIDFQLRCDASTLVVPSFGNANLFACFLCLQNGTMNPGQLSPLDQLVWCSQGHPICTACWEKSEHKCQQCGEEHAQFPPTLNELSVVVPEKNAEVLLKDLIPFLREANHEIVCECGQHVGVKDAMEHMRSCIPVLHEEMGGLLDASAETNKHIEYVQQRVTAMENDIANLTEELDIARSAVSRLKSQNRALRSRLPFVDIDQEDGQEEGQQEGL